MVRARFIVYQSKSNCEALREEEEREGEKEEAARTGRGEGMKGRKK